nr:phage protease [Rhodoferax sp. BLA1]
MSFVLELGAPDAAGLAPVPTEAHLLPPGPFRSTDGRPEDCEAWQLDATIAARVIDRASQRKNDVLIDYEHQSLYASMNGQPVIAAGWFTGPSLVWRETGLFATGIDWVAEAAERIAGKKYRYISAYFSYYASTGEVLEILSVALTNTPGLDGLNALSARAALSRSVFATPPTDSTKDEKVTMDPKDEQIAALTSKVATLEPEAARVAALTTERDTAVTALAALTNQVEKDKHTALLTAALSDGRLAPAQKAWAEKQSRAALTEYLDASKPLVDQSRQVDPKAEQGGHGLTEVELAACTRMGVTPEAFLAAKK